MIARKSYLAVMAAMFLVSVSLLGIIQVEADAPDEIIDTDWTEQTSDIVVGFEETLSLDSVEYEMNASIYVEFGGILYINDSYFRWGGSEPGEYGLYVEDGGWLYMDNVNMTAIDQDTYYHDIDSSATEDFWGINWHFRIDGSAVIEGCELSYMWADQGNYIEDWRGGIECHNDNVYIGNCTIFNTEKVGITSGPDTSNTNGGCSPRIYNVKIRNATDTGVFFGGAASQPSITYCTIWDVDVGAYYFYGAGGEFSWNTFNYCNATCFMFDPISAGSMNIDNCSFSYSTAGVTPVRAGSVVYTDCMFNNNKEYGIELGAYDALGTQSRLYVVGGEIKNNGINGVHNSYDVDSISLEGVEISNNVGNGIFLSGSSALSADMKECDIHDNGLWGIYANDTNPDITDCEIRDNGIGGVYFVNGSQGALRDTLIENEAIGARLRGTTPTFLSGNTFRNNEIGLWANDIPVESEENDFEGNNVSLRLANTDSSRVMGGTFTSNNYAMIITGGEATTIREVDITGSDLAITAVNCPTLMLKNSSMSDNTWDLSLDGGTVAYSQNCSLKKEKVNLADDESELQVSWYAFIYIVEDQAMLPLRAVEVTLVNPDKGVVAAMETATNGLIQAYPILEYWMNSTTTISNNPMDMHVIKQGYLPYHEFGLEIGSNIIRNIVLETNFAPVFPSPLIVEPTTTHNNKPTIIWNASIDQNTGDEVVYNIDIYEGSLDEEDLYLEVDGLTEPEYTFVGALKYHIRYYVAVEALDLWGKSTAATFSFETVNTAPSTPKITVAPSPASTLEDIVVTVVEDSIDNDTDPVDIITYIVEWYIYKDGTWELKQKGPNNFTFASENTLEGDQVKVIVKPSDGADFGIPAISIINIRNFAPVLIQKYEDIELVEDTSETGLINLDDYFFDRDNDQLRFFLETAKNIHAEIDDVTNNITFIPDPDWAGSDYIEIVGSDQKPHLEPDPVLRINITVSPVNDPPRISHVNGVTTKEGVPSVVQGLQFSLATIEIKAFDSDVQYGDDYTFSTDVMDVFPEDWFRDDEGYTFETLTGRMELFLTNDMVGTNHFNITVTDDSGASYSQMIELVVENINDKPSKPEIASPTDGQMFTSTDEGYVIVKFEGRRSMDPDENIPGSTEKLEYSWDFGDGTIIENQGLNVEHRYTVSNDYTVVLTVKDEGGDTASTQIRINISLPEPEIDKEEETPFMEKVLKWDSSGKDGYLQYIILVIVILVVIAAIIFFLLRKEPLAEVAETEEKEHEELVARQQQAALEAQQRIEELLAGSPAMAAAGIGLPAAGGEGGGGYAALPAAGEGVEPPAEGEMTGGEMGMQPPQPFEQPLPEQPDTAPPQEETTEEIPPPMPDMQMPQTPPDTQLPTTPQTQQAQPPGQVPPGTVPDFGQPPSGEQSQYLPNPEEQQ